MGKRRSWQLLEQEECREGSRRRCSRDQPADGPNVLLRLRELLLQNRQAEVVHACQDLWWKEEAGGSRVTPVQCATTQHNPNVYVWTAPFAVSRGNENFSCFLPDAW